FSTNSTAIISRFSQFNGIEKFVNTSYKNLEITNEKDYTDFACVVFDKGQVNVKEITTWLGKIIVDTIPEINAALIGPISGAGGDDTTMGGWLLSCNEDNAVEFAEQNSKGTLYWVPPPNDYYFKEQWALENENDCDIDACKAWLKEKGNKNVVVAVLDTGIDYTHEDLTSNIIKGYDFVDNDENSQYTGSSHGTAIAGIIAAKTNNKIGIAGIADVTLMGVRVSDDSGPWSWNLSKGIVYAAKNGAWIISISSGFGKIGQFICNVACTYAFYQKNVLIIAAAGQEDMDAVAFPARYESVIAVGGIQDNGELIRWVNVGEGLDLVAPAQSIRSIKPGNGYATFTGTSFAAPHVAGVAALIYSKYGRIDASKAKQYLLDSAVDMDNAHKFGRGLLNAYEALKGKKSNSYISVEVSLSFEKEKYKWICEPVNINLSIKNLDNSPFLLNFTTTKEFDIIIKNCLGFNVFQWSKAKNFSNNYNEYFLKPNEIKSWNITWNQTNQMLDNSIFNKILPGRFSIFGYIFLKEFILDSGWEEIEIRIKI
ncbi:MAG: S8 family serine peptidase, partial [Candidatus Thermoplasmatota archaeon]|nr:S8 family serine peptidase [Candidatus Thermoplasmatota archaeon]